ncbi:MAG: hypothetical protein Ct9H90mP22_6290 [Gammaproteobacteria bacterium]|nr:MAG: hypothetical protein Ct9H90mP22_6290 [Gammaproteobacteria bacterium]
MVSLPLSADFDNKCSVLITLRFQSNDDAFKDAISKIEQCQKKRHHISFQAFF